MAGKSGTVRNNGGGSDQDGDSARSAYYKKLNIALTILIVVSLIILALRFQNITFFIGDDDGGKNGNGGEGEGEGEGGDTVFSIIPNREAGIINGHEHIQDPGQAAKWLAAMDRAGVSSTILVGSPDATFWLNPSGPFEKYDENNEDLLKLVDKYPDRFIAFPTVYTFDDNKLESLKDFISRGAIGLKLFSGHHAVFYEHLGPLNLSTMYPIYEYCEAARIPIIWHVHLGKEYLRDQFKIIMDDFPNLIINIPHFMLSSINLWQSNGTGDDCRLRYYLEKYPNLYTDVSFGYWVRDGLWRISNHTQVFRDFIIEFQDRFTFGTDMVCTEHPRKDVEWIANLTRGYTDILEKKYFNLTVEEDIEGDHNGDNPGTHNGLELPQNVLDKIYYDNMIKFINCKPYTMDLEEVIKQSNLTYQDDNSSRAGNMASQGFSRSGVTSPSNKESLQTRVHEFLSLFILLTIAMGTIIILYALPVSKKRLESAVK